MRKNSTYFYKIVLAFLVTVTSTTMALTAFSYQQFSDVLIEKSYAGYQSALRKNEQSWQDLLHEMEQLKSAILVDPQTESFLSLERADPTVHYNAYLKVKKLFNINPYVESMCVLNQISGDRFFCGTDELLLEELWDILCKVNGKMIEPSRLTGSEETGILVFGYPVYVDSFEQPQGAILICLNQEMVREHVMGQTQYGQFLVDSDGTVLLDMQGTDQEEIGTEMVKRAMWENAEGITKEILEEISGDIPEQAGIQNQIVAVGSERYLNCVYWENGFLYGSYANQRLETQKLRTQRTVFLFVCLGVTIVGALVQIVTARRIYRPIGSIRKVFEQSKWAGEKAGNEFEMIRQVYESAMREIEILEEENASYLPGIKAEIIRGLILGNLDPQTAGKRLSGQGYTFPFSGMFMAGIRVEENVKGIMSGILLSRIQQLLLEKLGERFWIESVTTKEEEVVALINTLDQEAATFEELIVSLEWIRDQVLAEYPVQLSIALDGIAKEIEDIPLLYRRVRELQKNCFVLGYHHVIDPGRVMELLPEPLADPEKLMREIVLCMVKQEREQFVEKTDGFFEMICQYTWQAASVLFIRLYVSALEQIPQNGLSQKSKALISDAHMNPKTVQEAKKMLMQVYEVCSIRREEAEHLKENKHYKKIMESQQFIRENYADLSLGVELVAEQFGYSANYFARVFKSITGFYANDYIRQVRIRKAQELLQETDLTVNEISEVCGFATSNYFHSIFKKETGMTPAAYRGFR